MIDVAAIGAQDHRRIELAEQAVDFARTMLVAGRAVILDVETVSLLGPVCEIAVIDASSGVLLLDTLVNPGVEMDPQAYAVHGITDAQVRAPGVPSFAQVFPRLLDVTEGRTVLAYNADYDRDTVWADCRRYGRFDHWLMNPRNWADVMVMRSQHRYTTRLLKNGGGHRAADDVAETRRHLLEMTELAPWPAAAYL